MRVLVKFKYEFLISAVLVVFFVTDSFARWENDGTPVCTAPQDQRNPMIIPNGLGGVIIAWSDNRDSGNANIYVQCVNSLGDTLWTKDGVAICMAMGDQEYATIVSDGAGGAIIAWQDHRSGEYDIYAQRVDASGNALWTPDGLALCTFPGDQIFFGMSGITDDSGGAIFAWWDFRDTISCDVYAQRIDASGMIRWTANGVMLSDVPHSEEYLAIASDGAGGAIVAWDDKRTGGERDIYAQKVDASGVVQWELNGVALCTAAGLQRKPAITSDGSGGAIVAWHDGRNDYWDIYAQQVSASGDTLWVKDGVPVCTAGNNQQLPTIISDGASGAIVSWEDYRFGNWDIYAARINSSGLLWTVPICTASGFQYNISTVKDGTGGIIVTWKDERLSDPDIYSQRVDASGVVQWDADGVALCTAEGEQKEPMAASDGEEGAIVAWYDQRTGEFDIYAQRVNSNSCVGDCPPVPLSPSALMILAIVLIGLGATAIRIRRYRETREEG